MTTSNISDDFAIIPSPLLINPANAASRAGLYISPQTDEESLLGTLMVVLEIESREKSTQTHIQSILNWWSSSFSKHTGHATLERLESLCREFNDAVYTVTGKSKEWMKKVDMAVALYNNGSLHLSQTGSASAWLVRRKKIQNVISSEKDNDCHTLFAHLSSGSLTESDTLLLTTQGLFDFFSLEKITTTISNINGLRGTELFSNLFPDDGTRSLATIISEVIPSPVSHSHQADNSFSSLSVSASAQKSENPYQVIRPHMNTPSIRRVPRGVEPSSASQSSMHELNRLERSTDHLLDPSQWIDKKRAFARLKKLLRLNYVSSTMDSKLAASRRPGILSFAHLRRVGSALIVYPFVILRTLSALFVRIITNPRTLTSKFREAKETLKEIPNKTTTRFSTKKRTLAAWYAKLPKKQQFTLILIVLFIFVFILGLGVSSYKKLITKQQENFQMQFAAIEGKLAAADAALIYQDNEKAKRLLAEADDILNSLPEKKRKEFLLTDTANQLSKIKLSVYRVVVIDNPKLLVDFSTALPETTGSVIPNYPVFAGKDLYIVNSASNSLIKYTLSSGESETISDPLTGAGRIGSLILLNDKTLGVLRGKSQMYGFSLSDHSWSKLFFPGLSNISPSSITSYAGRAYILDITKGQIYRATPRANGYSTPAEWLTERFPFSGRGDIAVDGSIYVSSNGNIVYKFNKGALVEDFTLDTLDPVLDISHIITQPSFDYLYALDKTNGRLVRFDKKTGRLNQQYTSPIFNNLKRFVVDKKEQNAYILNGTKLYKIEL